MNPGGGKMTTILTCWRCGAPLEGLPLPIGRSAECPQCRVGLRVCRLCEFYDQQASKQCREPQAEPVQEKERANFCDYFRPRPGGGPTGSAAAERARSGLDALFGSPAGAASPGGEEAARQALANLFGKK
jgi:hypothetical protein